MTMKPKTTGSLAGKLMLSGALILSSGAYAWWQDRPDAELAALQPVAKQPAAIPKETQDPRQGAAPPLEQAPPDGPPAPAPVATAPDLPSQAAPPAVAVDTVPPAAPDNTPPAQAPPALLASNAPPEPAPQPAPPQSSGRYANGDFTGPSTDTPWGTVQVRVHVQGGAIAEVEPIDYPNHRRRSIQINEWALPVLEREVIQAQSANADIVSQATTTSVGYLQSLAGALAQAKR
jgi:uncharacterized protein with FMN-binding domain